MHARQDDQSLELLAPAGGPEAGYAALHYGADAIYLGLPKFSARAEAENFSPAALAEITGYAHALPRRRRIYVALNTLILQGELDEAIDLLARIADIGVDAVIIQDLGVGHIIRRHFPELRLHASTQMAIHNREGVEAARRLGFARVTLARELTLDEISAAAATPGIEVEFFVHGALCYAYSGLCLFSSQTLGRSGNRGRCAYLCREKFTIPGPDTDRDAARQGFIFSMKDLALPERIGALRAAGVRALKIEGRKKSALYVAAAVNFYRRLIDGGLSASETKACVADIKTIFSRPWTELFLAGRENRQVIDAAIVGHRGNPVGRVEALVRTPGGERRLRFRTACAIEAHDGLQLDIPGLPRPFGFAVERLKIVGGAGRAGNLVFHAPAGALVEVPLPAEHPEIPSQAVIYCASSQAIKKQYRFERPRPGQCHPRRPVSFTLDIRPDKITARGVIPGRDRNAEPLRARATATGTFKPALNEQRMAAAAQEAFGKLGATRLESAALEIHNPSNLFVPVSLLNRVRRELTDALELKLAATLDAKIAEVRQALQPPAHSDRTAAGAGGLKFRWSIKTDCIRRIETFGPEDWRQIDEVLLELDRDPPDVLEAGLERLADCVGRERIRLTLPPITREWERGTLVKKIEHYRKAGWRKWGTGNLAGLALLRAFTRTGGDGLDLACDWPVYVTNRAAALQVIALGATRFTLSPEDGLNNLRALLAEFGTQATVIVYQDTPLFISETCVFAGLNDACRGARDCGENGLELTSAFGDNLIAVSRDCRTIVYNRRPFCLSTRLDRLAAAGAVCLRADFTFREYASGEVREIWQRLRAGAPVNGQIANFDRGLE